MILQLCSPLTSSFQDAPDTGRLLYPPSDPEDEGTGSGDVVCGSSTESFQALDSTDESERIVERLVAMSESRSTSSLGGSESAPALIQTPPAPSPLSLDNSPGMAWKKTVLIPSDDTAYLNQSTFNLFKTAKGFTSPTKLGDAEWEHGSSDIDS